MRNLLWFIFCVLRHATWWGDGRGTAHERLKNLYKCTVLQEARKEPQMSPELIFSHPRIPESRARRTHTPGPSAHLVAS